MDILILVLSFLNVIFWILLGSVQRQTINDLGEKFEYLNLELDRRYNYFADYNNELKSILKEAGIIIEPPAHISVPDPRGYSVKKIRRLSLDNR